MNSNRDSSLVDQALALARSGAIGPAFEQLDRAVAAGNALAAATLADWRIAGDPIRRDLAEARRLYGLAADLGLAEAEPVFIAMLANGAGGSGRRWNDALDRLRQAARRDPLARRQRDLLAAMDIDAHGNPNAQPRSNELGSVPAISHFPGFLTAEECRYLTSIALPRLQQAVVIDPRTGQAMLDPVRVAQFTSFPFVHEDPVIHAINRRIAAATRTHYEQGEPLQVLSYRPGEEYKLHSDALLPATTSGPTRSSSGSMSISPAEKPNSRGFRCAFADRWATGCCSATCAPAANPIPRPGMPAFPSRKAASCCCRNGFAKIRWTWPGRPIVRSDQATRLPSPVRRRLRRS
ncbi:MAG: hypothetical protein ACKOPM_16450 [Novosphingobium sp.]